MIIIDSEKETITIYGVVYPYSIVSNRPGTVTNTRVYQSDLGSYTERKYILFGKRVTSRTLEHAFDIEGVNINDKTLYPEGVIQLIKEAYTKWIKDGCRYRPCYSRILSERELRLRFPNYQN